MRSPWVLALGIASVLVTFSSGVSWLKFRREVRIGEPVRFSLALPPHLSFEGVGRHGSPVAFSPDGSEIAVAAREGDVVRLYRRALREPEFRPVAGSERARSQVYSSDGQWLVFVDKNQAQIKSVPVAGGLPEKLHSTMLTFFGVHQGMDGSLWFGECGSGLVCRRGDGKIERITRISAESNAFGAIDSEHSFPEMLPGGSKLLYTAWTSRDAAGIQILDLAARSSSHLVRPGVAAKYLPRTRHLIYGWEGDLYSAPFDPVGRAVNGKPSLVLKGVAQDLNSGAIFYTVSVNGSLAYIPGGPQNSVGPRVWVNWKGEIDKTATLPYYLNNPRISPDGTRICFQDAAGAEGGRAIWVYAIDSGVRRRLTGLRDASFWSLWTPDSRDLIITSGRDGTGQNSLYRRPADGSGDWLRLTSGSFLDIPASISPDGRWLLYTSVKAPGTPSVVHLLDLEKRAAKGTPASPAGHVQMHPEFSPDGRWVAMVTDQLSKEKDVVIYSWDNPLRMWKVSEGGAMEPIWSRDGKRLFYRDLSGSKTYAADLDLAAGTPRIGPRKLLFTGSFYPGSFGRLWDVHPDGKRILFATTPGEMPRGRAVEIVLNWDGTLPAWR